jgi:hypothetical protein
LLKAGRSRLWFLASVLVILTLTGVRPKVLAAELEPGDLARAIIDKAIKAHGGAAKLEQLRTSPVQYKAKGTLHQMGGIPVTMEVLQAGIKSRIVTEVEVNGIKVVSTMVTDGDDFWLNVNGMNLEVDEKMRKEIKERMKKEQGRRNKLGDLPALLTDKAVTLNLLGEVQVEGKPAVGVRVTMQGHADTNLFFDKAGGLLVKSEERGQNPLTNAENTFETVFLDYKEFDGLSYATRNLMKQDGTNFMEIELLEWKLVDRLDENLFTRP